MEKNIRHKLVQTMDRISALPDDVVFHILSSLSTKLSVSTSILARRWRYLWSHVPVMDFNFLEDYRSSQSSDIIDKVMSLHKGQTIHTLKLYHDDDCDDYEFEKWITIAYSRNVRNLDVCLDYQFMLPQCLFICKTLVHLTLKECGNIPMSGIVYLPALKKLKLDTVEVTDESLPHLLSGCPMLEELSIDRVDEMIRCCISLPTLNRLVFVSENLGNETETYTVEIDTPALRYLKLHDSLSKSFSAGPLTSLIEADVMFLATIEETDEENEEEMNNLYSRSVLEFISKLYNVRYLKIATGRLRVPDSAFFALTINFRNLTELELHADWRFLSIFFENAGNLEVLTITMINDGPESWMAPHQVSTCLSSHLKTVTIHQFGCTVDGFELIRYLLRSAKVLKLMEIFSNHNGRYLRKRILKFDRGAEACELKYHRGRYRGF